MAMEIYTSAPTELDSTGSREVGTLGCLRIVNVDGSPRDALNQLNIYKNRGFFASVHRSDALEFVVEKQALERRIDFAIDEIANGLPKSPRNSTDWGPTGIQ